MKTLFAILIMFGAHAFAMGVGSYSILAGEMTDSKGNVSKFTYKTEAIKIDQANNQWEVKADSEMSRSDGTSDVSSEVIVTDDTMMDGEKYFGGGAMKGLCGQLKGVVEQLTVPVGTFETCKVEDTNVQSTTWYGAVPYHIIKMESTHPNQLGEINLIKYEIKP